MKADKNYKMSSPAKVMLANIDNKAVRAAVKNMIIDSEVTYEYQKKYGSKREKIED